mmetsp:Transcript_28781/g.69624  ORF Transcript_28781/g.69624 Transcript_28781/m.69624 type:complete len:240 (-) Transcript_28781:150-869(-)|eukprot:CAMPEP_0113603072 /NCGR_PEP_ID=MMETSP0017_2-20120614/1087_1 /TAXON_ID=2856 /ORGANISM="Cylindrotheca closterium" /LENGTH=239 /DNA_ID=CAMNT_0000511447 /DNA_START=60 /DNA_END=779 /DNA_ORIENTATION=+ /assembly_acc=CAM_ASM_000147
MYPLTIVALLLLLFSVAETSAFLATKLTDATATDITQRSTRVQSTAGSYLNNLGGGSIPVGSSYGSTNVNGVFSVVPTLSLEQADAIANNVVTVCQRNGFSPVAVTVLDASGSTIVSKRMDGCSVVGIPDFSRAKAYSCVVNKYPSRAFRDRYTAEEASAKFCQMTSMVALSGNQMAPFPGGIVLKVNDYVIGAVGVSGAAGDEDEYCAITAVQEASIPGLMTVPAEHSCTTVNEPYQS